MSEDKAVDLYVLERALVSTHPNTEFLVCVYMSICHAIRRHYIDVWLLAEGGNQTPVLVSVDFISTRRFFSCAICLICSFLCAFLVFVCPPPCVRSQFELILAAYRAESKQSKGTLAALKEVRARGRKRVMLG